MKNKYLIISWKSKKEGKKYTQSIRRLDQVYGSRKKYIRSARRWDQQHGSSRILDQGNVGDGI